MREMGLIKRTRNEKIKYLGGNLLLIAISEQLPQEILWRIVGSVFSYIPSTFGNILNTRQALLLLSLIYLGYYVIHISKPKCFAYT